jgi:hypothetical protein
VLIQVALQTTESNELAAGGVVDTVSRINSRFSTLTYQPVVFLHVQDLTFNQYLALLTVADAFIVTSLREGMALRTHEYVECQEGRYRPLVLSEFTGSYSYSGFRSCIPINPWNTKGTADAIYQVSFFYDTGGWMDADCFGIGIDYERRRGPISMGGVFFLLSVFARIYLLSIRTSTITSLLKPLKPSLPPSSTDVCVHTSITFKTILSPFRNSIYLASCLATNILVND